MSLLGTDWPLSGTIHLSRVPPSSALFCSSSMQQDSTVELLISSLSTSGQLEPTRPDSYLASVRHTVVVCVLLAVLDLGFWCSGHLGLSRTAFLLLLSLALPPSVRSISSHPMSQSLRTRGSSKDQFPALLPYVRTRFRLSHP